jgi:hypothetical protein
VITKLDLTFGSGAAIVACVMAVFLPPSCCLPYFFDDCKDVSHTCPECGNEFNKINFML